MTRRALAGLLVALVVAATAGACSDDDDDSSRPASTEESSRAPTTTTTTTTTTVDDCTTSYAMDTQALGVAPGDPRDMATAFVVEVMGWADATVSSGTRPCSFRATSPSHPRPVDVTVRSVPDGSQRVSGASSFDDSGEDASLGVGFHGTEVNIFSGANCETCVGATVHIPYAGGVETVDSELPVEAHLQLPEGASQRGIIILVHDESGEVQAVQATSIPDGDFAAG